MAHRSATIQFGLTALILAGVPPAVGLMARAQPAGSRPQQANRVPTTVHRTYRPTDEVFPNPERGFYRAVNLTRERDLHRIREAGYTLVFSYVRLDAARGGPIPDAILEAVEAGLQSVRTAGLKVILRCAYNNGPYPNPEPDAPKERVLEHIRQLRPLYRRNEDVIAVVQAGFIGAWGEWHTSTNGLENPADRRAILEALLDALPPTRMVQIRTPQYKQEIYGEALTDRQAFNASPAARIGHHNDCFLANETDMGTYPRGQQERWKEYLAAETRFLPMGGETCSVFPARTDCGPAVAEMKRLHFSYINQDYHRRVIDGWTQQGCRAEIERGLGYRLQLVDADVPETIPLGGGFRLRVRIRNQGWAAPFNPRPVFAVLDGDGGRHVLPLPVRDIRRWEADREQVIEAPLRLPSAVRAGTYRLALWLPDASARLRGRPEYAIRLANEGIWEAATGFNLLGNVTITKP